MSTTSDFRTGLCIELSSTIFQIVYFQHVKPGKGGAFVRTKLRNIKTGAIIGKTFNSGVKITSVRVEKRLYQCLYKLNDSYAFMCNETYEQVFLPESSINAPSLLKEGELVDVLYHVDSGEVLSCELPSFVYLAVKYTDPGVRGDTVNKVMKPATLETGKIIQVPIFIELGELLKVDTRDFSYVERAKKKK